VPEAPGEALVDQIGAGLLDVLAVHLGLARALRQLDGLLSLGGGGLQAALDAVLIIFGALIGTLVMCTLLACGYWCQGAPSVPREDVAPAEVPILPHQ
jgi:hypothetical protein